MFVLCCFCRLHVGSNTNENGGENYMHKFRVAQNMAVYLAEMCFFRLFVAVFSSLSGPSPLCASLSLPPSPLPSLPLSLSLSISSAFISNTTTALVRCRRHGSYTYSRQSAPIHCGASAPQWFPHIMSFKQTTIYSLRALNFIFVRSKWMRFRIAARFQVKFRLTPLTFSCTASAATAAATTIVVQTYSLSPRQKKMCWHNIMWRRGLRISKLIYSIFGPTLHHHHPVEIFAITQCDSH